MMVYSDFFRWARTCSEENLHQLDKFLSGQREWIYSWGFESSLKPHLHGASSASFPRRVFLAGSWHVQLCLCMLCQELAPKLAFQLWSEDPRRGSCERHSEENSARILAQKLCMPSFERGSSQRFPRWGSCKQHSKENSARTPRVNEGLLSQRYIISFAWLAIESSHCC